MIRLRRFLKQLALICMVIMLGTIDSVPVFAAPDPNDTNKGDLNYYTVNGIFFYEGGLLHCGTGGPITGGAAGILAAQKNLDPKFVTLILNEAKLAETDPIAMASLLFWEHRGFPPYGQGPVPGESDSVGRGPWQFIRGSWPSWAGPYDTNVYDPVMSTKVAADYVKRNGGAQGSPIGSIDQDFSKGKNLPSMATVAKNYNAGQGTWREPGVAGYKQDGRIWRDSSKVWGDFKQNIIDDYILGMTYAYYLMATQTGQLGDVNTSAFVAEALANKDKIKNFKFGDSGTQSGGNVANSCASSAGNGDISKTAFELAWRDRNRDRIGKDYEGAAKPAYQQVMRAVQGDGTADSIYEGKTAWTDCGVFVATTMRHSGADPNYQKRGTALQLPYLRAHGKAGDPNRLYDIIEGKTNTDGLLPGDIFIVSGGDVGHTFVYVGDYTGDDGKKYDSLSASWGQRVPMANNSYFIQDGYHYVIARPRAISTTPTPPPAAGAQP